MIRKEAVKLIAQEIGNQPIISANGFMSRDLYETNEKVNNFYMIGSMGLASSMGLGVALSQPEKKAVILDGDGNVLMAMGTLAMIAAAAPKNLVHVTIDNRVYESTGSQKTLSGTIELHKVAESVGYRNSSVADDLDTLKKELRQALDSDGPSFILARVEPNFDHQSGRVIHTPEEIKQRFMTAIKS